MFNKLQFFKKEKYRFLYNQYIMHVDMYFAKIFLKDPIWYYYYYYSKYHIHI